MRLRNINPKLWLIQGNREKIFGEIYLDYVYQVEQIVIDSSTTENDRLEILRLALHHAIGYARNRNFRVVYQLTHAKRNCNLTPEDSKKLMDFDLISDEVRGLSYDAISSVFNYNGVKVTIAVHQTAVSSIKHAMTSTGIDGPVFETLPRWPMNIDGKELIIRFAVKKPNQFTLWNDMSEPLRNENDLYIVPQYHPVMNDWTRVGLVNGDTDAYICGHAIKSVHCPKSTNNESSRDAFGSSFGNVSHPYKAVGQIMEIVANATDLRSSAGAQELTNFLFGVLNADKKYIGVSGGFRGPLEYPENQLLRTGHKSPWPSAGRENKVRGSEAFCVWAYRVLTEERVLEQSCIPEWFKKEKWLEIYGDV